MRFQEKIHKINHSNEDSCVGISGSFFSNSSSLRFTISMNDESSDIIEYFASLELMTVFITPGFPCEYTGSGFVSK